MTFCVFCVRVKAYHGYHGGKYSLTHQHQAISGTTKTLKNRLYRVPDRYALYYCSTIAVHFLTDEEVWRRWRKGRVVVGGVVARLL